MHERMLGGACNRGLLNGRQQPARENRLVAQQVIRALSLGAASENFDHLSCRTFCDRREHAYEPPSTPPIAELRVPEFLVRPVLRRPPVRSIHARTTVALPYKFRQFDDLRSMVRRKRGR